MKLLGYPQGDPVPTVGTDVHEGPLKQLHTVPVGHIISTD